MQDKRRKAALISIDILHFTSLHFTSQTSANFDYRTQLSHLAFLANALSTSFVGQCSRWHCSKKSASSRSSVMVERIDVSVRYNLQKTRSDSDVVTISIPTIGTQHSVDVWKLDTATTAECCRSIVRGLFCCSRCPLLTPENNTRCKIFLDDGGPGGPPLYTPMMRYEIRPEPGLDFILALIALLTKEPEMWQTMHFARIQCSKMQLQPGLCSSAPNPAGVWGCTTLSQIL